MPSPGRSAGKNASVAISSAASVDSSGPAKSSSAGIVRVPRTEATSTEPPSSASTTGISAAASACTIEPTVVPRLRIVAWATFESASATSGWQAPAATSARTSACRANAPTRTPSPSVVTWSRSGNALMSTSVAGDASRIESSGTRLWPPASTFAPGSPARATSASWRVPGRR